VSTSTR